MKKGTAILMYDGTIKNCEDIIIGDIIMGDDSTKRIVTNTFIKHAQLYKIIPKDSTDPYYISENNILCMKYNTTPILVKPCKKGKELTSQRYRVRYTIVENKYNNEYNSNLSRVIKKVKNFSINVHGHDEALEMSTTFLNQEIEFF